MARLLDDLLDVSRVTQGKIRIRPDVVDLRMIAEEAIGVVQPLIESSGHSLQLDLPAQPVCVQGDASRLVQAVENLLENAAKYTPPGGQIRFAIRAEHGNAVLHIADNGRGIEPEMQVKIFELFVQGNHSNGSGDAGMGIGLTLVQSIARLHNGHVFVRSEGVDKGSEFEMRLPLTSQTPTLAEPEDLAPDAGVRVVIVEDNADNRELLYSLLRLDGYDVRACGDGLGGLATIIADPPDVALVDIELPGMNGYEIARRVKSQLAPGAVRLVALTGYGRSVDCEAVKEAGFDEHLVKPVDPSDLARVLRKPR
jgi:two-component system CheB/CheR fusion protein